MVMIRCNINRVHHKNVSCHLSPKMDKSGHCGGTESQLNLYEVIINHNQRHQVPIT